MANQIKNFSIKLWIKDKETEEIIELSKKEDLAVWWKGDWGKAEKEVVFKKSGKDYRILVRILSKKYLLGVRSLLEREKFLTPPNTPYEIYKGYMGEPNNSPEKDAERNDQGAKLTNQWNWGRIAVFLLTLIITIFVLRWCFKKKKINNICRERESETST